MAKLLRFELILSQVRPKLGEIFIQFEPLHLLTNTNSGIYRTLILKKHSKAIKNTQVEKYCF